MSRFPAPTASAAAIKAACDARAAAAEIARSENRETVRCDPTVTHHPAVGGYYPERVPGPRLGTDLRTDLRDWSGIIAQCAAFLVLAALAFLG